VAQDTYCDFPERDIKRIAMPEIFDFISGADTGAIIASTLIVPKKNKADDDW
jgi:patatin-like phospholipase/acyl hydrolase